MTVHLTQTGPICHIELDRPDRSNAVDLQTLQELQSALTTAQDSRVVVLSGRGKHFCAGADLTGVEGSEFHEALAATLRQLRDHPSLTVAACHRASLGLGVQLAMFCDLRSAASGTWFGVPAAKLGIMVDEFTVGRLVSCVGSGTARHLLLSAAELPVERAHALGFVHRVEELQGALEWANELAQLAPLSIQGHKRVLNSLEDLEPSAEMRSVFDSVWASNDAQEGPAAFGERRPPEFTGT